MRLLTLYVRTYIAKLFCSVARRAHDEWFKSSENIWANPKPIITLLRCVIGLTNAQFNFTWFIEINRVLQLNYGIPLNARHNFRFNSIRIDNNVTIQYWQAVVRHKQNKHLTKYVHSGLNLVYSEEKSKLKTKRDSQHWIAISDCCINRMLCISRIRVFNNTTIHCNLLCLRVSIIHSSIKRYWIKWSWKKAQHWCHPNHSRLYDSALTRDMCFFDCNTPLCSLM